MSDLDAQNRVPQHRAPAGTLSQVLLSGGSGMLGSSIAYALESQRLKVIRLVRTGSSGPDTLRWAPEGAGVGTPERLEGISAAIHLSGANVAAKRWTAAYKREIWNSRVRSTRVLAESLARLKHPPRVLLAASAVGWYGDRKDELLDETSAQGVGFFPELGVAWEAAARPAVNAGIRVVHLRSGIVLAREGGAMQKMVRIFRLGLGGKFGNGRQWMSWIAETDLVAAVLFLLTAEGTAGPVNVVAPNPVTNDEFTCALAGALHRPALLPAPGFGLRLVFGQMADEALLASARVLPAKLQQAGFTYQFPLLGPALDAILR